MRKRRFRDRSDGYYLTKLDPIVRLMPYIMAERTDAHVYFQERVDLKKIEPFLKKYRSEHKVKIGFMHIVMASMVRVMAEKPKINRFVAGSKLYARKHIAISYTMKKRMIEGGDEAAVKNYYEPTATLEDIVRIVNEDVRLNRVTSDGINEDDDSKTETLVKVLDILPGFMITLFIRLARLMDGAGILPKTILEASPFHTSMYITNLGSLGIKAVYHHIFNIGTTSLFFAFGKKEKAIIKVNGAYEEQDFIDIKVVADERIVDGYYFAKALKLWLKYIQNPEYLLTPTNKVETDTDI